MNKATLNLALFFGILYITLALCSCWNITDFVGVRLRIDTNQISIANSIFGSSDATKDRFFYQKLDHCDKTSTKTWKQRYFLNDMYFNGTGPVFLMIGGESTANPNFMLSGFWIEQAKIFGALCVMLEHRYYGISVPTPDLSTDNLKYLTSEHALEDLASFRTFIHDKYYLTDANRWIVFGGSYPGSLSAWLRLKYPHLIYAAVSSSAPVLAKTDFLEYYQVVGQSLSLHSLECTQQIREAVQVAANYLSSSSGLAQLKTMFNLCSPVKAEDDARLLFWNLAGNFASAVQYDQLIGDTLNIANLCGIMTNESLGSALDRLIALNNVVNEGDCLFVSYKDYIEYYKSLMTYDPSNPRADRQWFFQTCAEFGFFQTSDSKTQPFGDGFPLSFLAKMCSDVFGKAFLLNNVYMNVANSNTEYGGLDFQVGRVVFVNGDIDPWHALSLYQTAPNNDTQVIFIKGAAHCADMSSSHASDSAEMKNAHAKLNSILSGWLKN